MNESEKKTNNWKKREKKGNCGKMKNSKNEGKRE